MIVMKLSPSLQKRRAAHEFQVRLKGMPRFEFEIRWMYDIGVCDSVWTFCWSNCRNHKIATYFVDSCDMGGLTTNPSEVWMNTWVDIAEPVYAFAASHNAFVCFEATLEPM